MLEQPAGDQKDAWKLERGLVAGEELGHHKCTEHLSRAPSSLTTHACSLYVQVNCMYVLSTVGWKESASFDSSFIFWINVSSVNVFSPIFFNVTQERAEKKTQVGENI